MLEIKQIRSATDYEAAVARISALLNAEPYSPDDAELDRLSNLAAGYEAEHFPIPQPSAAALLEFMLEQGIVSRRELLSLAGGDAGLDAILAGRLEIPSELAQLLHQHSGSPVENPLAGSAKRPELLTGSRA